MLQWIVVGLTLVGVCAYIDLRKRAMSINPATQAALNNLRNTISDERTELKGIYRRLADQIAALTEQVRNGEDPADTVAAIEAIGAEVAALSEDEQAEEKAAA